MRLQLNYVCLAIAAMTSATNAFAVTDVPLANAKTPGFSAPNILSPELDMRLQATGAMALDGATAITRYYGYINNGGATTFVPVLGSASAPTLPITEASKTEPDKNVYLILDDQTGTDHKYNYGQHFLFQGHESGEHGYITRINLDADGAHRVTLLADTLADGSIIPNIDGVTWNPFAEQLMFTGEEATTSGVTEGTVLQASAGYPSTVTKLDTIFGIAGWEGIQLDSDGNIWLVADQGGKNGTVNTRAKQPNSFVYRFIPKSKSDITRGGKLQALQVTKLNGSSPIVFHDGQADADITSQEVLDLHTYGKSFKTTWVTVHDTDVDGFVIFDANIAAKTAKATPFKRPENGVFRPSEGRAFQEFYFTETGDTDKRTQVGAAGGGFGAVFRLIQNNPSANNGTLQLFYLGDEKHAGFDNIAFATSSKLLVVEDAGDTLHTQRNALDSGYVFDTTKNYGATGTVPIRFIAEGRDASATLDSGLGGGDNEITGIHVSNGDASIRGLLGSQAPTPFSHGWRVFWNQQHGDNNAWEIVPKNVKIDDDDRGRDDEDKSIF
jgi:Bacterial protein of unknown function (DUF839)